jgi:geranylgeranyl reductase family protein
MRLWDAIVIGAGPAGCAAAYDLARSGREVLLLDRAEFPRQKACAGGLTLKTVRALRYSVEPVTRQQLAHIRIESDSRPDVVLRQRAPYCFMTVRQELDDYCLRQTIAAGAHHQRIRSLNEIEEHPDRVTLKIDGQTLHTRFLIGADGVHSRVRQLTQQVSGKNADWFWRGFALEACVRVANPSSEDLIFDFAPVRDGYGWIFPKGDHVNIGLYSYSADEKIDRARLSAYIRAHFGDVPAEDIIGQYAGFGAAQHTVSATRTFLVGDAGGFVDPLTGEGIYFAVVSGQAAAEAVEAALHSGLAAHLRFQQATASLRADLAVSTSAARWFYNNLEHGCTLLAMPWIKGLALRAFAEGLNLSELALRVRKFVAVRPRRQWALKSLLNLSVGHNP